MERTLAATGEIGLLKLVGESAVASGVRRVEAVTGTGSLGLFRREADVAKVAAQFVGGGDLSPEALKAKAVGSQEEEMKKLRRELESLKMKSASGGYCGCCGSAVEVKGVKVLSQRVDGLDKSQMRNLVDELRGKLGSGVVVLGAVAEGKVSLIVGVSKDLTGGCRRGRSLARWRRRWAARVVGGRIWRRRVGAMLGRSMGRWRRRRMWWGRCWGRVANILQTHLSKARCGAPGSCGVARAVVSA